MIKVMISVTPRPVFRLVNTKGFSPRIFFVSASMASREAPTMGARSILLITRRSERVIPGPPSPDNPPVSFHSLLLSVDLAFMVPFAESHPLGR